jgi:hypothetical protein
MWIIYAIKWENDHIPIDILTKFEFDPKGIQITFKVSIFDFFILYHDSEYPLGMQGMHSICALPLGSSY